MFVSNKAIEEHLNALLQKCAADGKKKLRVHLQDDPSSVYILKSATCEGGVSVAIKYSEPGELREFGARVSADEDAEGHVRLTAGGIEGIDEDGERISVRIVD